ncbi:hypothetical protein PM082_008771 [Marasmius tenuissimus]|nr:hypothetical protein PM082_008771 [Marasmius tenuissimus]
MIGRRQSPPLKRVGDLGFWLADADYMLKQTVSLCPKLVGENPTVIDIPSSLARKRREREKRPDLQHWEIHSRERNGSVYPAKIVIDIKRRMIGRREDAQVLAVKTPASQLFFYRRKKRALASLKFDIHIPSRTLALPDVSPPPHLPQKRPIIIRYAEPRSERESKRASDGIAISNPGLSSRSLSEPNLRSLTDRYEAIGTFVNMVWEAFIVRRGGCVFSFPPFVE